MNKGKVTNIDSPAGTGMFSMRVAGSAGGACSASGVFLIIFPFATGASRAPAAL